jgi:pentatricopeptide repeat protein
MEGFHHWEVRKEMQDAYNALINAAGQAGKYKLAESLFSEVLNLGLPFPLKDLLITAAI